MQPRQQDMNNVDISNIDTSSVDAGSVDAGSVDAGSVDARAPMQSSQMASATPAPEVPEQPQSTSSVDESPDLTDAEVISDLPAVETPAGEASVAIVNPDFKWYAIKCYSGQETGSRQSLLLQIESSTIQDHFGEVMVPTESIVEVVKGKRRKRTRKLYPGYMYVQMKLTDESQILVKNSPRISGFVGGHNPVALQQSEIDRINKQVTEGAESTKTIINYAEGDNVKVTAGPFSNFNGSIEEVNEEKQKLRVLVSIFGRETPIELDYTQVERTE